MKLKKHNFVSSIIVLVAFVFVVTLAACGGSAPDSQTGVESPSPTTQAVESVSEPETSTSDAYPVDAGSADDGYPVSEAESAATTEDAYPVDAATTPQVFILDSIDAGVTTITGQGVAGTPIQIVSVTEMGEPLGSGEIDQAGRFEIQLGRAITPQEKVGIQPADSQPQEEFSQMSGVSDIPMLGFFLDIKSASNE